jgi:hypothetical protein
MWSGSVQNFPLQFVLRGTTFNGTRHFKNCKL